MIIEGYDDGLKTHELRYAALERRAGNKLKFELSSWIMQIGVGYERFSHEVSAYRSQWGFDGKENTLINSHGSIQSNGGRFSEYGINSNDIPGLLQNFSVDKLKRNKNKNPALYSIYRMQFESFGVSQDLSKQILMDSRLTR